MLAYMYVGGSYGWYRIWSLKQQKAVLEAEVSRLEARRLDLSSDLELLRGDPKENPRLRFEMERLAREKHGMVRKDELVYRFHPEEPK
jgi:cell division protein FtsB